MELVQKLVLMLHDSFILIIGIDKRIEEYSLYFEGIQFVMKGE